MNSHGPRAADKAASETREYTILLTPDEDGGYVVSVPLLPGCFTQGATREEAIERAREAISVHLLAVEGDDEPIPVETQHPELVLVRI